MPGNVLFIVIDQLRADCLRGPLAAHVPTPNLDRFAAGAAVFANHSTVTAPCGPARASMLTGLYASRHGAVRNGVPMKLGLTNLALEARKLGYEPLLFGYTDAQPDPALHHANDPDLLVYEGVLPGFREIVEMRQEYGFEWPGFLRAQGYDVALPFDHNALYRPRDGKPGGPALYRAEHSDTAYLTDRTLEALDIRRGGRPWFAHVTYIRPHPPFVAPAPYNTLIDPASLPAPLANAPDHPLVRAWFSEPTKIGMIWGFDGNCRDLSAETAALIRATYLGLVTEVDDHVGRLLRWLEETGQADDTLVVITSDHGEMLGDFGMWGKDVPLSAAFHVPLLIRAPGNAAQIVEDITESVDVTPTILDWLGGTIPAGLDGASLLPLIRGEGPAAKRTEARFEIELSAPDAPTRFGRALDCPSLRAVATATTKSVTAEFFAGPASRTALPPLTLPRG